MSRPVSVQPQTLAALDMADWASGVCDCCDDKSECCFAFWCCPCFACRTSKRLGHPLCLPLLDIFGCIPPIAMSMRASVRQRYGIQGSLCNDCACSTFCLPCVWCQMSRELKNRKIPAVLGDIIHRR